MPEKTKKQQQICEFSNDTIFICDDITNGTVLITDRLKIPKTNLSMNLIEKELCHHHYNKLIVNKNHRLANAVKKQQCAHPKHEVYIKNSKKGRPRKHTLVKIPQRLQPILNLPTGTLICNPCLIAMDHDEENKQFSDYQPPIQKILLRIFLLFKGVKSLYFTYSIVNFTALNLPGITSLHLLTTRVGLLLLKSVRLFLQTTGVA